MRYLMYRMKLVSLLTSAVIHMMSINFAAAYYSWVAKVCRSKNRRPVVSATELVKTSHVSTGTRHCARWKSQIHRIHQSQNDEISVTFETASNQKTFNVQKGEILRSAMLKRGISPHNGRSRLINCRGLGTCGTCAVEITCVDGVHDHGKDNSVEPKERNAKERLRLNFPPHGGKDQSLNLRLACQVQVNGDIMVKKRTGFWGQGVDELAEEYESQLWFGELEYILDDKSPSPPSPPPPSSKDD